MIFRGLKENYQFLKKCWALMAHEKVLIFSFMFFASIATLTEGVGISLLVPVLETQTNQSTFSNVPILREFSALFEGMEPREKLKNIAIVLGVVLILRGLLTYIVEAMITIIPFRMQRQLMMRGYRSLLTADFQYFSEKGIGDHLNSLREWGISATQLLTSLSVVFYNTILLFVYLGMMLAISWELAIIAALFVGGLTTVLKIFLSERLIKIGKVLSFKTASLNSTMHETMTGMRFIKLSAAESVMTSTYEERLFEQFRQKIKLHLHQNITSPFLTTVSGIFVCLLLFSAAFVEGSLETWLSNLLMFLFLVSRLLSPISRINIARNNIASNKFALEMLDEFFEETSRRAQKSGKNKFSGVQNNIKFENVSFGYQSGEEQILKNLSVDIPAGKMVAIVGPSGSGKSTFISLLTRFYEAQEGSISIDGTNIKDIDIYDFRKRVGVVSQDVFIFNESVKNNLTFSLNDISQQKLEEAVKLAAADGFISEMTDQFDTEVGDSGMRLSGGQQQRLAVARAILRDPEILILDEATSNLDTYTEKAIQEAVETLRKDKTIIVIAHRLSTIQHADKVIVLKEGEVIEEGTHNSLIKAKGAYWDMVSHQQLNLVDD